MKNLFKIWIFKLQTWLNKLLVKYVNISDSNEVVKVVTKKIGVTWINMENHVQITNKFIFPYKLEEVKLTYYNDAGQNVGYLHFKGPQYIGPFARKVVKMPAKMSNITALFNMVRLMVVDDIKTRTVGTTTIKLLGMYFELPIDDIMVIDKKLIVMDEESEEEKQKRLAARSLREKERAQKRAESKERHQKKMEILAEKRAEKKKALIEEIRARKERVSRKREARMRLKRMKSRKEQEKTEYLENKEPQDDDLVAQNNISADEQSDVTPKQESSTPDRDKSYLDPTT